MILLETYSDDVIDLCSERSMLGIVTFSSISLPAWQFHGDMVTGFGN